MKRIVIERTFAMERDVAPNDYKRLSVNMEQQRWDHQTKLSALHSKYNGALMFVVLLFVLIVIGLLFALGGSNGNKDSGSRDSSHMERNVVVRTFRA